MARLCSALHKGHCEQMEPVQVPGRKYVVELRFKPVSRGIQAQALSPQLWEGQCGEELREP